MFYTRFVNITVFAATVVFASALASYGAEDLIGQQARLGCLAAPTGLSASDGTYADKVRLEWHTVSGATGYEVWRNTSDDLGSAVKIATRTWTAFEDKSMTPCIDYWYWVCATGACGTGDFSTSEAGSALGLPPPPTGVTASKETYPDKIRVEWKSVVGATVYSIKRSTSDDPNAAQEIATRTWTAFEDRAIVKGTTYWYWVKASAPCGEGAYGDPDWGKTYPWPAAPTGLTASDGTYTDKVRLEWRAAAGATGYEVWRNTSNKPGSAVKITTRTWTACEDRAVTGYTTYYYWVRGTNEFGAGDFSAADSGYRLGPPAAPVGLTASKGTYPDKVRLEWAAVPGATGYEVWRNTAEDLGSAQQIATRTWAAFEDRSGVRCTTYWHWVRATNSYGGGDYSAADWGSRTGVGEQETILLPGDVPLTMMWIPSGTFWMGRYAGEEWGEPSEDPQHQVTFASGFWIGKYELTQAQWTAVMGTTPWFEKDRVLENPNSPASYVSWDDAQAFIAALNTYTGLTFHLPSESAWEYACRAGTTTRFYWGDDPGSTLMGSYSWYWANCYYDVYAHIVGGKTPNAWGLYDMSGNVFEWCEDDYVLEWCGDDWCSAYTGAPTDGSAWVSSPRGSYRSVRGGGFYGGEDSLRSASRDFWSPSVTRDLIGFRLCR